MCMEEVKQEVSVNGRRIQDNNINNKISKFNIDGNIKVT